MIRKLIRDTLFACLRRYVSGNPQPRADAILNCLHDAAPDALRTAGKWYYDKTSLHEGRFALSDVISIYDRVHRSYPDRQLVVVSDLSEVLNHFRGVSTQALSERLRGDASTAVICAFSSDQELVKALRIITEHPKTLYFCPEVYYPTARYFHRDDVAKRTLLAEAKDSLSHYDVADFENLAQVIQRTRHLAGAWVEIGVYKGRSARFTLEYMKQAGIKRSSWFLDLFEGFTYSAATHSADASWAKFNPHDDTSLATVSRLLQDYEEVHVRACNIVTDSLPAEIDVIAGCNIDVDLYEAVLAALTKVAPRIAIGGIMIVEDQGHTPPLAGALLAVEDFLATPSGAEFCPIHMASGQMLFIRVHRSEGR